MSRAGASVAEIAAQRQLPPSTIEGHLAAFDAMPAARLGEVKAAMGDDVTFGELRLVQAHRIFLDRSGRRKDDA